LILGGRGSHGHTGNPHRDRHHRRAPFTTVAADLADPASHHEWATEFFAGPVRPGGPGEFIAPVPMMGGEVRHRIDADVERGILDLYVAPPGAPYGPPIPVRLVPNGDGTDVLWTWPASRA
jgi:hypothetical protein